MTYTLTTEGDMPVSISALRDHCRIQSSDFDTQLSRAWYAAAYDVEVRSGLLLRPCTVRVSRKGGSGLAGLVLPVGPVDTSSIVLTDENGTTISAGWEVDLSKAEPTICITDRSAFDADTVYHLDFDAGLSSLPADLNVAVLELTAHHFENREATTDRPLYQVPSSVWAIVANHGRAKV